MKNILNLVYDNWNEEANCPYQPNAMDLYINSFHMPIDSEFSEFYIKQNLIRRYKLEDIKNYSNKIFFYFVTLMPNLIKENIIKNRIPIPIEVIKNLKIKKNLNLLFINRQESEDFETIKMLHIFTKSLGLNQKQVWIVNNNSKLYEYGETLKTDMNLNIQSSLSILGILGMQNHLGEIKFKPNKEGNLFMCHNRRGRIHRYALLCLLKKYNILDDTDWSLVTNENLDKADLENQIFTPNDIKFLSNEIDYFSNIKMKKSKYETNYDWFDNINESISWSNTYEKNTFENSYFNITTESHFLEDGIHITEKSLKAFYGMQFPLILTSHGHIKEIKKLYDFDWFDDVINHSYDDEPDARKRLFAFVDEIKRINQNKEFFIEFYKNNEDRFIKNYKKAKKWINVIPRKNIFFIEKITNLENE